MKNSSLSIALLAGAFGVLAFSPKLTAAEGTMPACCGGMTEATTVADAKAKPYPLDTCIVSGEKLGEMGKPFTFVYQGQEIKLCCKSCKKDFDKEPEKFLKKLAPEK
jgi:YHS domain-containing protein